MVIRLFTIWMLVMGACSVAEAGAKCSLYTSAENAAVQSSCAIKCAAFNKDIPRSGTCRSVSQSVLQIASNPEKLGQFMSGCGSGALEALFDSVVNLLAPEEYRKFMAACQKKDSKCRLDMARNLEKYRARKPNGEYQMTNAQVRAAVQDAEIFDLVRTGNHNAGLTYDSCQRELGNITRALSSEFSQGTEQEELAVVQKRYAKLLEFDADCPRLLHMEPPTGQNLRPDLGKGMNDLLSSTRAISQGSVAAIGGWFDSLGIAFECQMPDDQGKLLCLGLGRVLMPSAEAVFAAKAIRIAKNMLNARVVTQAAKAEALLGRKLIESQKAAVEKAHLVGDGLPGKDGTSAKIGNYTPAQLREKADVLRQAGFSEVDRRRLMEAGIVGLDGDVAALTKSLDNLPTNLRRIANDDPNLAEVISAKPTEAKPFTWEGRRDEIYELQSNFRVKSPDVKTQKDLSTIMDKGERDIVYRYTMDSEEFNTMARSAGGSLPCERCDRLTAALAKIPPYEGQVYRGTYLSETELREYTRVGATVQDQGFLSTSRNAHVANDFLKNPRYGSPSKSPALIVYRARTGRAIEHLAVDDNFYQREVLFRPQTRFEVQEVTTAADGTKVIYMVEK